MSDRWFKVQTSIVRNEKVLRLTRTHRWALIELWANCAEDLTDGIISRTYCDQMIGKKSRNVLLENGFLHWVEEGQTLQVHDYLSHQSSREETIAKSEKRRQAGRKGGIAKAAKQTEENQTASNLPDPEPSNLPPETSSKNVADLDLDIDNYSPKYPTSPELTREQATSEVPAKAPPPETARALALVRDEPEPAPLPQRLPDGRRIPRRTRQQMLAALNATSRSGAAAKFVSQFESTLDGKLDRRTAAEVGQIVDELFADGIDPRQVEAGLRDWHQSDSWSPTQIRRFVTKAAATQRKPSTTDQRIREANDLARPEWDNE